MNNHWKTGSKETVSSTKLLDILKAVSKSKNHKIIIGTDSVKLGYNFIFTTAICVFNDDFYDRKYFYVREKIKNDIYLDLHKRLLKETQDSINIALLIKEELSNANIEIHADVNSDSKHLSAKYNSTVTGYITGCGFKVKTKPDSFVASSIADLHTRKV